MRAKEMFDIHRFRSSAQSLRLDLQCARSFAVAYGAEVVLTICILPEKSSYRIKTDEPQHVLPPEGSFKETEKLIFKGKPLEQDLVFTIDATGRISPYGTLILQKRGANEEHPLEEKIILTETPYAAH